MIDINWGERPSDKHVWAEDVRGGKFDCSGWRFLVDGPKGMGWQGDADCVWDFFSVDSDIIRIHHKPESDPLEPYKPVVGEWCEAYFRNVGWCKRCYLGFTEGEEHVVESFRGSISLHSIGEVRPIKTEREQFIEKAAKVLQKNDQDVTDLCNKSVEMFNSAAKALYEAGFKGPDK